MRNDRTLCFFDVFYRLVDHMVRALLHEIGLVERDPQEVADLLLDCSFQVVGQNPVQVAFPADDTSDYLIEERLQPLGGSAAGKEPVNGFVEGTAALDITYDGDGQSTQKMRVIFYAPSPRASLSALRAEDAC